MKRLGIISYNTNHLKTEQIVLNLLNRYDIRVYALPFVPRPSRDVLFRHRPDQSAGAHPAELCNYFGLPFIPVHDDSEIDNSCDLYLIAGAGILSAKCLRGKRILNGHPGVIPAARGLDAFKWSIYHLIPLGVTLHYIDEGVDAGQVLTVIPTLVFSSDTLESLARRHYENEIKLLSNFEQHLDCTENPFEGIRPGESMRRMKYAQEQELKEKFELYKDRFSGNLKSSAQGLTPPPPPPRRVGELVILLVLEAAI